MVRLVSLLHATRAQSIFPDSPRRDQAGRNECRCFPANFRNSPLPGSSTIIDTRRVVGIAAPIGPYYWPPQQPEHRFASVIPRPSGCRDFPFPKSVKNVRQRTRGSVMRVRAPAPFRPIFQTRSEERGHRRNPAPRLRAFQRALTLQVIPAE